MKIQALGHWPLVRLCAVFLFCAGCTGWSEEPAEIKPLPVIRAANITAASAVSAPPATNAAPTKKPLDMLEFLTGDTLRGRFLGWDAQSGLRWQHEGVQGDLRIIPEKIRKLRLQRPPERAAKAMTGRLWLHNGDRLAVNIVSLDAEHGVFETWYAGTVQCRRGAISNLVLFYQHGDVLYHGPTGLEGWQQSGPLQPGIALARNQVVMIDGEVVVTREARGDENQPAAWTFTGDALEAVRPGAVGRDFKLPRASMVSLELEAPNTPAFTLHLYADAPNKFTSLNALSFTFSGRMIYFRRSLASGGSRQIGNVDHQKFSSGSPVRTKLTICTDLDQQSMAVYLDDTLIRKFSIAGQVDELGTALVLQQQAATSLKISNVTISRWNGVVEDAATAPAAHKADLLLLNNRDKISGKLLTIRDGKVTFESAYSKIEIPLERIQLISLAPSGQPSPDSPPQARLLFGDAGRLTLQIQRWTDTEVEGESPHLGAVKLNARTVIGLQYE